MTLTILGIVGAMVPLAVWLIRRWITKRDETQPQRQHDQDAEAIVKGDTTGANARLDDLLGDLQRMQNNPAHRHPGGQGHDQD